MDEIILKTDTVVGKALKIDDRTLYPIIQISTLKRKKKDFIGAWIFPLAIVIEEPTKEYVILLTDEDIDQRQLLDFLKRR